MEKGPRGEHQWVRSERNDKIIFVTHTWDSSGIETIWIKNPKQRTTFRIDTLPDGTLKRTVCFQEEAEFLPPHQSRTIHTTDHDIEREVRLEEWREETTLTLSAYGRAINRFFHANYSRGKLASIAVDTGTPPLQTLDRKRAYSLPEIRTELSFHLKTKGVLGTLYPELGVVHEELEVWQQYMLDYITKELHQKTRQRTAGWTEEEKETVRQKTLAHTFDFLLLVLNRIDENTRIAEELTQFVLASLPDDIVMRDEHSQDNAIARTIFEEIYFLLAKHDDFFAEMEEVNFKFEMPTDQETDVAVSVENMYWEEIQKNFFSLGKTYQYEDQAFVLNETDRHMTITVRNLRDGWQKAVFTIPRWVHEDVLIPLIKAEGREWERAFQLTNPRLKIRQRIPA